MISHSRLDFLYLRELTSYIILSCLFGHQPPLFHVIPEAYIIHFDSTLFSTNHQSQLLYLANTLCVPLFKATLQVSVSPSVTLPITIIFRSHS